MGRLIRYRDWKQCSRYYTRNFHRQQWRKAAMKIPASRMSQLYEEKYGIKVIDPLSDDFPRPKASAVYDTINHPLVEQRTSNEDHPLYKERPCFRHDGSRPFADGLKHALVLTKSLVNFGLPSSLLQNVSDVNLEQHQNAIFNLIMQSQAWDSTLEKLPHRRDQKIWWRSWPRYYGIPQSRKNNILLDNLYRYSMISFAEQYPGLKCYRCFKDGDINAMVERKHSLLRICCKPRITISSPIPLNPLNLDLSTCNEELISIYPIGDKIDLIEEQIYDHAQVHPLMWSDSDLVPRTLMLNKEVDLNYPWTSTETVANAMMACFSLAASYAHKKYALASGSNVLQQVLPRPVTVQAVQVCQGVFDFVVFQLNTLDLNNDSGIKNIFWIEQGNKMFSTPPHYETFKGVNDYNPEVFQKFLAIMLNGLT